MERFLDDKMIFRYYTNFWVARKTFRYQDRCLNGCLVICLAKKCLVD